MLLIAKRTDLCMNKVLKLLLSGGGGRGVRQSYPYVPAIQVCSDRRRCAFAE